MTTHVWTTLPKWAQQDLQDMAASHCTSFERCDKCHRLHDRTYVCPFCGHDNSDSEEEA